MGFKLSKQNKGIKAIIVSEGIYANIYYSNLEEILEDLKEKEYPYILVYNITSEKKSEIIKIFEENIVQSEGGESQVSQETMIMKIVPLLTDVEIDLEYSQVIELIESLPILNMAVNTVCTMVSNMMIELIQDVDNAKAIYEEQERLLKIKEMQVENKKNSAELKNKVSKKKSKK